MFFIDPDGMVCIIEHLSARRIEGDVELLGKCRGDEAGR